MRSHPVRDVVVALIIGMTVYNCVDIATKNSPAPQVAPSRLRDMVQDELKFCQAEVLALRQIQAPKK